MVDLVCVLPLLVVLLIRLVLQHLDALATTRLILTGLGHREQLAHLVLGRKGEGKTRNLSAQSTRSNMPRVDRNAIRLAKLHEVACVSLLSRQHESRYTRREAVSLAYIFYIMSVFNWSRAQLCGSPGIHTRERMYGLLFEGPERVITSAASPQTNKVVALRGTRGSETCACENMSWHGQTESILVACWLPAQAGTRRTGLYWQYLHLKTPSK